MAALAPIAGPAEPPRLGLSLAGMHAFMEAHGGRAAFDVPTQDVVFRVKQLAHTTHSSYCALPEVASFVGPATVFIVNARTTTFTYVVDAIETAAGPYFWLDVFSANHWDDAPSSAIVEELARVIRSTSQVLVVLPNDPSLVLSRSWCLYELLVTHTSGTACDYILPLQETTEVLLSCMDDPASFRDCFFPIAPATSACSRAEDHDALIRVFMQYPNCAELLCKCVLLWFERTMRSCLALNICGDDNEVMSLPYEFLVDELLSTRPGAANASERLSEAKEMSFRMLTVFSRVLGPADARTLGAMAGHAMAVHLLGDTTGALRDLSKCNALCRSSLGDLHLCTVRVLMAHVTACSTLSGAAAVSSHLPEALASSRIALGVSSPIRQAWLLATSKALLSSGNIGHAVELARECMHDRRESLGWEEYATLEACVHYGHVLEQSGQLEEAESVAREILAVHARVDNNTMAERYERLHRASELMLILVKRSKFEEAIAFGESAAMECVHWFGERDLLTLQMQRYLLAALLEGGKAAAAVTLGRTLVEFSTAVLGGDDLSTLAASGMFAKALQSQGEWEECDRVRLHAIEVLRRVSGPAHTTTLQMSIDVVDGLRERQQFDKMCAFLEGIVDCARDADGKPHPDTMGCLMTLSATTLELRKHDDARVCRWLGELGALVAGADATTYRDEDDEVLTASCAYLARLGARGCEDALGPLSQLLPTLRRKYGSDSLITMECAHAIACLLSRRGQFAAAYPLFKEAATVRKRQFGRVAVSYLASLAGGAECLHNIGKTADAAQLFQMVVGKLTMMPPACDPLPDDLSGPLSCYLEVLRKAGDASAQTVAALLPHKARRVRSPPCSQAASPMASLYAACTQQRLVHGVDSDAYIRALWRLRHALQLDATHSAAALHVAATAAAGQHSLTGASDIRTLRLKVRYGQLLAAAGDHKQACDVIVEVMEAAGV